MLDGLGQLVDKSLVVADATPPAPGTGCSRRSASTRSNDSTTPAKPTPHADATPPGAPSSSPRRASASQGPDEAAWSERLDREIDNIRAALTWATGTDDADLSLSLIGTFGIWHLYTRPVGYVLGPWAAAALATTGATDDPRFADVLAVRALDHLNHRRLNEAERDARQALELMAEPDTPFSANPWCALSIALTLAGRADEIEGADAFVEAARATGDDPTLATALLGVAIQWWVLANQERCLPFAEQAMLIAQRIGNPTLIAMSATWLGGLLETTDPPRARTILETAIEHATTVTMGSMSRCLLPVSHGWEPTPGAHSGRRNSEARSTSPTTAGDTASCLLLLDLYAQALATTDRAEIAAVLAATVGELSPHTSNPNSVAHRRDTNERLLTQLGEERLAELTAHGANLGYEDAVALARAELDRVIANNEG